jgi:hypothetical protein
MSEYRYPFGRPVTARPPSADVSRNVMVIGAYPSALYVRWIPPSPWKAIKALPVDDEPMPFWSGRDEAERISAWLTAVTFDPAWGTVESAGHLNGSSGAHVDAKVLAPLGVSYSEAWITDCIDTYCASETGAARIADTYAPFALARGLPAALVRPHPSEGQIVAEAVRGHIERLRLEIMQCRPGVLVTLGNAALRVVCALVQAGGALPDRLCADTEDYGRLVSVTVEGRRTRVLPLAHPAAPPAYREVHAGWVADRAAEIAREVGCG